MDLMERPLLPLHTYNSLIITFLAAFPEIQPQVCVVVRVVVLLAILIATGSKASADELVVARLMFKFDRSESGPLSLCAVRYQAAPLRVGRRGAVRRDGGRIVRARSARW